MTTTSYDNAALPEDKTAKRDSRMEVLILVPLLVVILIFYLLYIRPQPLQSDQSPVDGGLHSHENEDNQRDRDAGDETGRSETESAGVRGRGWRGIGSHSPQKQRTTDYTTSEAFDEELVGVVVDFWERTEQKPGAGARSEIVWTFRVERYREGHRLASIGVEIRGRSMRGSIRDGDMVIVRGVGPGLVKTRRVYNATTSAWVGRRRWL